MYCSKCGNELEDGSSFCSKCSSELGCHEIFINSNPTAEGVTVEELKLFVGENNQQYYIPKWMRFRETKKYNTWNWAAFFLSLFWLAYRKMYLHAIGLSAGVFVLTEILPEKVASPLGIVLGMVLGMFGNKLYYEHAQKEIIKIKNNTSDLRQQEQGIISKGGTSAVFALLFGVAYFGIAFAWGIVLYLWEII